MEVLVSGRTASGGPVRARAQRITVTTGGPAATFTYEADAAMAGPVQQRTWTVQPAVWRLTVPPAA
jgi:hypothetical protein